MTVQFEDLVQPLTFDRGNVFGKHCLWAAFPQNCKGTGNSSTANGAMVSIGQKQTFDLNIQAPGGGQSFEVTADHYTPIGKQECLRFNLTGGSTAFHRLLRTDDDLGIRFPNPRSLTIVAIFRPFGDGRPGANGDPRIYSKDEGSSGPNHDLMIGLASSGNNGRTRIRTGSSTKTVATGAIQDDALNLVAGMVTEQGVVCHHIREDGGHLRAIGGSGADYNPRTSTDIAIGANAGTNDNAFAGDIICVCAFDIAFDDVSGMALERFFYDHLQVLEQIPESPPSAGAAPNKLDAVVPLTFALSPDLKSTGQLDAAVVTALTVVADLKAAGQLDAAAALAFTIAAELKAAGELNAAVDLAFSIAADLKAVGKLDAAIATAFTLAADLRARGQLDAAVNVVFTIVADLKAASANAIDASVAMALSLTPDLKASGTIDAGVAMAFSTIADLKARGELDAAAALAFGISADLRARGQLNASAAMIFSTVASLSAAGKLDAAPAMIFSAVADLTAAGKLDAAVNLAFTLAPDLKAAGVASLDAAIAMIFTVSANLTATGQLDAAPAMLFSINPDLRATGALQASPSMAFTLAPGLAAAGSVSASPAMSFALAPDLTVGDQLRASVAMNFTVNAPLVARGSLLAAVLLQFSLSAMLVDGAAQSIPNSIQDLIVSLFNSFQGLQAGPNSGQILTPGKPNSSQTL